MLDFKLFQNGFDGPPTPALNFMHFYSYFYPNFDLKPFHDIYLGVYQEFAIFYDSFH